MDINKFDPATDATIQQFLDLFVTDPVLRLAVEEMLSEAVNTNPHISPGGELEALAMFSKVYLDARQEDARKLIAYGANAGVLGMLEKWRESKKVEGS
jgi:hypothetical protein